ncbi:YtpI family protein [Bacillus subtilis]|nr:YtpI family protein [Bacillus subtilis]
MYETSLSLIIGILFVLFGSGSILAGIKAYKYYQPYAIKEADQM